MQCSLSKLSHCNQPVAGHLVTEPIATQSPVNLSENYAGWRLKLKLRLEKKFRKHYRWLCNKM